MGNTCLRRAREIKHLIDSKSLDSETIQTDEELQKLMHEIILEECANSCKSSPDSEFAQKIFELQNTKINLLKKGGLDCEDFNDDRNKYVNMMMRDIMNKVIDTQKLC